MNSADDFGTAKAVADLLKGLDAERQSRILRWVSESLGIRPAEASRPGSPINPAVASPGVAPDRQSGATNIKSFLDSKDPKSDNQFAASVAYYHRFEAPVNAQKSAITPEDLQEATRLSGRRRLGDPAKTLRNAKDMGYLDAVDRGQFAINSVGENLVAMTLPAKGRVTPPKTKRRTGKAKNGKR